MVNKSTSGYTARPIDVTLKPGRSLEAYTASFAATVVGNTITVDKAGELTINVSVGDITESVIVTVNDTPQGLKGDVNCDGVVRMNDLVALLSHLSASTELSAQGKLNADVTGEGKVLMNDLVVLLNFLSTGVWN